MSNFRTQLHAKFGWNPNDDHTLAFKMTSRQINVAAIQINVVAIQINVAAIQINVVAIQINVAAILSNCATYQNNSPFKYFFFLFFILIDAGRDFVH